MLFYGKILLRAFRRRRNFRYFLPQLLARQHVHVSWRDQPLPDDDEHPPPCPPLVVGSGLEIQMMLRAAAFAAALTGLVRLVWKIRERKERSSTRAHFGDLMGDEPSDRVETTSVSSLPGENNKRRSEMAKLTEFERVVLTANGNLQRIISACFNEPVTVEILQNEKQECDYKYFRKVKLRCGQRHFCTALSMVTINDKKMQNAVDQRKVGIGQLFRVFNILPKFRLLAFKKESSGAAFFKAQQQKEEEKEEEAGKWGEGHRHLHLLRQAAAGESGQCEQKEEVLHREMIDFVSSSRAFWRLYRLEHRKFSCTLLEEFPDPSFFEQLSNGAWHSSPEGAPESSSSLLCPSPASSSLSLSLSSSPNPKQHHRSQSAVSLAHFGDIMAGTRASIRLPSGLSCLERMLVTANGNLQRIVSSLLNRPVRVSLNHMSRRGRCVFDRRVSLSVDRKAFCHARNIVEVHNEELLAKINTREIEVGYLFRSSNGILPRFRLLSVIRDECGNVQRRYTLEAPGIKCMVQERFDLKVLPRRLSN